MIKIDLKNATERQRIKGFGASACWWSQNVATEKTAQELCDLLYTEKGLNLNIYRYNIGAGWDDANCRVPNPWRKCESFYINDDENEDEGYCGGGYDWSRDKNAYNFMKLCIEKGNVDTVILFANSPHYALTSSGQASGSLMHHTCNLPNGRYKAFAKYFLDITEHFINDGIPVTYISPINEPQWKWGGKNVWQEGCHYEPEEVCEVFRIFAEEIEKRGLSVKLYGPESGEIGGKTQEYLNLFKQDEVIMRNLGAFAVHSYHSDRNVEIRKSFYNDTVLENPDIRFDMSEWCELPCLSDTKSINGALNTARVIGWDLCEMGAESWTAWVAVNQIADTKGDSKDYSDGLLSASNGFSYYYICKRYYALLHFTKFLKHGDSVLDCALTDNNGINIFAFKCADGSQITVAVNEGEEKTVEFSTDLNKAEICETTQKHNFKQIFSGELSNKITLKAKSITTVRLWK